MRLTDRGANALLAQGYDLTPITVRSRWREFLPNHRGVAAPNIAITGIVITDQSNILKIKHGQSYGWGELMNRILRGTIGWLGFAVTITVLLGMLAAVWWIGLRNYI